MQTDAAEEEDAPVEICVEEKANQLTHQLTERPVVLISVIVDEERQGEDVKRVADVEVDHVDGAGLPVFGSEQDDVHGRDVQRKTEHKHQSVTHREENVLEVLFYLTAIAIADVSCGCVVKYFHSDPDLSEEKDNEINHIWGIRYEIQDWGDNIY